MSESQNHYYVVAVYWPKDGGYGGIRKRYQTADACQPEAAFLKRLGYGKKRCPIHIIKQTPDQIVQVIDDNDKETGMSERKKHHEKDCDWRR